MMQKTLIATSGNLLVLLSLGWLGCGFVAGGGRDLDEQAGSGELKVDSLPLEADLAFRVGMLLERSKVQREHRQREWEAQEKRLARLKQLRRKRYASAAEVTAAELKLQKLAYEREAEDAFRETLQSTAVLCGKRSFPTPERDSFHRVRLPGITQPVGRADYFVIRVGDPRVESSGKLAEGRTVDAEGSARDGLIPAPGGLRPAAVLTREGYPSAAALLRFRAGAVGEMRVREAELKDAERRHEVFLKASGKGVVHSRELEQAELAVEVARLAQREAIARSEIAQLEWGRFRQLAGEWEKESPALPAAGSSPDWEHVSGLRSTVEQNLNREGFDAREALVLLELTWEFLQARTDWMLARDRRTEAERHWQRLRQLGSVRTAELDRQKSVLDLEEAKLVMAEERLQAVRLETLHWCSLSRIDATATGREWSLRNAAAWGKRITTVKAELEECRRKRASLRSEAERGLLLKLEQVKERGAASSYEVGRQEFLWKMAQGATISAQREQARAQVGLQFLESVGDSEGRLVSPAGDAGFLPEQAWTLLEDYVASGVEACPGRIQQWEAARDLWAMRRQEFERLDRLGLARAGERSRAGREQERCELLLARERGKQESGEVARELVAALARLDASPEQIEEPITAEKNSRKVLELAPLP